ncbi:hypothetical protein [Catenovulum maritimum]|uniref:Lipoprotein n=1 Tax=Catenovulum maritimum TaxID=1513271 RepID=A0A0J8GVK7_9ALTE|nr:hypothetical protein [Catenovulum maritimum]KMT66820.1 hypothetical protein XM47_01510 [Catenovulum maritimum]
MFKISSIILTCFLVTACSLEIDSGDEDISHYGLYNSIESQTTTDQTSQNRISVGQFGYAIIDSQHHLYQVSMPTVGTASDILIEPVGYDCSSGTCVLVTVQDLDSNGSMDSLGYDCDTLDCELDVATSKIITAKLQFTEQKISGSALRYTPAPENYSATGEFKQTDFVLNLTNDSTNQPTLFLQKSSQLVASNLDQISGNWTNTNATSSYSIDSVGNISGSNQAGCIVSGKLTGEQDQLLEKISLVISGCTANNQTVQGYIARIASENNANFTLLLVANNDNFAFGEILIR